MRRAACLALILTLFAACSRSADDGDASRPGGRDEETHRIVLASALKPFEQCDQLLDYFQEGARRMGPENVIGGMVSLHGGRAMEFGAPDAPQVGAAEATAGGDAAAAAPPVEGEDFSGTNVQEAGVDEPDVVKTDGRRIVAVARNKVHVIEAGERPRLLGSVEIPGTHDPELLLDGDRALVIAQQSDEEGPRTAVIALDLSDPARPKVADRARVDGSYVTARAIKGTARVVLTSEPRLRIPELPAGDEVRLQEQARAVVDGSTLDQWVPSVTTAEGGTEPLVGCDAVQRPPEFSGLGMVSVVTFKFDGSAQPRDTVGVAAAADTVYASTTSLYVATSRWSGEPRPLARGAEMATEPGTEIHKFDISDPDATKYRASGKTDGDLLSQWSLSEHEGNLRVATTRGTGGPSPEAGVPATESGVVVLAEKEGALVPVGEIAGLGKGERIHAVRFMGDLGYVVTFRRTDPLYVIDLSDASRPRLAGELKIPGYSAYLHPVGEGLLLGVGQDATEQGQVTGVQLSLFDVSDPARPTRLHQTALAGGQSGAEFDHRAFLWWAKTNLAVVPVQQFSGRINDAAPFAGAVAFTVDRDAGVKEKARITHAGRPTVAVDDREAGNGQSVPPSPSGRPGAAVASPVPMPVGGPVTRTLVVGDAIYTLSPAGLLASDLDDLSDRAWMAL